MAKKRKSSSKVNSISPFSDAKWRVESDLRTLTEAEEIRRDPARLKKAQALAKEKLAEMASVAGDAGK